MPRLIRSEPVLASLDLARSVEFYCTRLGFEQVHLETGVWAVVRRDEVVLHFWPCSDPLIAQNTSCRIYVEDIAELFQDLNGRGVVHPSAPLHVKPWGTREFGALDPDGNLITFAERVA